MSYELPVRLPGELRSSPPEIRGVLGPRLCFITFMVVGVLTCVGIICTAEDTDGKLMITRILMIRKNC